MATGPCGIFVPLVWRQIGVQWVQLETGVAPTPSPVLKPLFPENTFILVLFLESKENQMLSGNLGTQRSRAPNYREDLVICHIKGGQGEERARYPQPTRISTWASTHGPEHARTPRPCSSQGFQLALLSCCPRSEGGAHDKTMVAGPLRTDSTHLVAGTRTRTPSGKWESWLNQSCQKKKIFLTLLNRFLTFTRNYFAALILRGSHL